MNLGVDQIDKPIKNYAEAPSFKRVIQILKYGWKNIESIKTQFEYDLQDSLSNLQKNYFDPAKEERIHIAESLFGDLVKNFALSHFPLIITEYRNSDRLTPGIDLTPEFGTSSKTYLSNLIKHEPSNSNFNIAGVWRSITGKMKLNRINNYVNGFYDWYGYEYSGGISGEVFDSYIKFNWDWENSKAIGEGIFYTKYKNILIGGWWYSHENIDLTTAIENQIIPGNQWIFHRFEEHNLSQNSAPEFDVVKNLISKNDVLTAITTLENYCKNKGLYRYINECILLKNRYHRVRQAIRLGIEEDNRELNKIILALLELIEIIEHE